MDFRYTPLFQLSDAHTPYQILTRDFVETIEVSGRKIIKIKPEGLRLLARTAMKEIAFFLRQGHLEQLVAILKDSESSDNDRYVAAALLRNALVAADQLLPSCQDTGTAIVVAHKGEQVWTMSDDAEALSHGIYDTYTRENLRYSQMAALSMFEEVNTNCNLPAQIDIFSSQGDEYHFVWPRAAARPIRPFSFRRPSLSLTNRASCASAAKKYPCWGPAPVRPTMSP